MGIFDFMRRKKRCNSNLGDLIDLAKDMADNDIGNFDANALCGLGELTFDRKAITYYEKAIAKDPKLVRAWYGMGFRYLMLGDYENAILCFDKTLELDPTKLVASADKGEALEKLGRYEEALVCYNRCIEGDPAKWRDGLCVQVRSGVKLKNYTGKIRLGGIDIR